VIDADLIGRQVVDQSPTLRKALAHAFGSDILTPSGKARRKLIAQRAFKDRSTRTKLNQLVHPFLLRGLRSQLKQARKRHDLITIDAALLLEWEIASELDFVLVIHASHRDRMNRMTARGIGRTDALARERTQMKYRDFSQRADRVMLNNGRIGDLRRKLMLLLKKLGYHVD